MMQNGFKILLDMDGVLVDFVSGICDALGKASPYTIGRSIGWDMHDALGVTEEEFWEPCEDRSFWEELGWMPDGERILKAAVGAVGEQNVYLSTSPSLSPNSYSGKASWVADNMAPGFLRRLMVGPCKWLMANPRHILVDDADHNVSAYRDAGGPAVLVPRPWNSLRGQDTIRTVQSELWRATS